MPFLGPAAALHKRNRRYIDYSSGLVELSTLKPRPPPKQPGKDLFSNSLYQRPEKDYFYVALIPADAFLEAFKDPVAFAGLLEERGEHVVQEWPVLNRGKAPLDRVMAERSFVLHEHHFRGERNSIEVSQYTIQLSTFGYTAAAKQVPTPEPIQMRDLKASLACTQTHTLCTRRSRYINKHTVVFFF